MTFISPAYPELLIHKSGVQLAFGALWGGDGKQSKDLELGELNTYPAVSLWGQICCYLTQQVVW